METWWNFVLFNKWNRFLRKDMAKVNCIKEVSQKYKRRSAGLMDNSYLSGLFHSGRRKSISYLNLAFRFGLWNLNLKSLPGIMWITCSELAWNHVLGVTLMRPRVSLLDPRDYPFHNSNLSFEWWTKSMEFQEAFGHCFVRHGIKIQSLKPAYTKANKDSSFNFTPWL